MVCLRIACTSFLASLMLMLQTGHERAGFSTLFHQYHTFPPTQPQLNKKTVDFLKIALSSYNSYNVHFMHSKCTIHYFGMFIEWCNNYHNLILEHFYHSKKKFPARNGYHPPFPTLNPRQPLIRFLFLGISLFWTFCTKESCSRWSSVTGFCHLAQGGP